MGTDQAEPERPDRRRLLKYGGLALLGLAGAGVGIEALGSDDGDGTTGGPTATPSPTATPTPAPADEWLATVNRFAPALHFGRRERWYPTDPRAYVNDRRVVEGIPALRQYTQAVDGGDPAPNPTVFYHVVPVSDSIVALQYWMYSVFDQFAVNFHWHDWELLQVFVDADRLEPVLFSASAHARSCPNNEFLRPDLGPEERPVILSEVGSHSSTTDVNRQRPSFQRLASGPTTADVSNAFVRPLDGVVEQPFAYGLPRDEGLPVPYSLPELDDELLHDHLGLDLSAFVDQDVTIRSWRDLARPPTGLPRREAGLVLTPPETDTRGDATYTLVPLDAAADRIDDFAGPQLSFEFAIPGVVEDQFASHLTTAGVPWEDPRSTDPLSDVTDPAHRRAIDGAEPPGLTDRVIGGVTALLGRPDGQLPGQPDGGRTGLDPFVPVSLFSLPVEVACLLRSDPVATVTAGGVFRFLHVDPGRHELIINGPGIAPYAERFEHAGGTVRPGVGGRVTVVPAEDAVLVRGDRRDGSGVARVRVVEHTVGPIYDAQPVEAGRFAVPVHRAGTYTVEVLDEDGVRGAVRVDPEQLDGEPIADIEVGKAALARALAEYLFEAAEIAADLASDSDAEEEQADSDERQPTIASAFAAAAREASLAADIALEGDAAGANGRLEGVVDRLLALRSRIEATDRYTAAAASLLRARAAAGIDRAETAYATPIVE